MKELAAICKVSVATVSYALRGDERISESVRNRIQAKAREHNYSPDAHSSALVRYRSDSGKSAPQPSVGILYPHPRSSRRTQLIQPHIQSFRQTITPYGYSVKEFFLSNKPEAAIKLAERLKAEEIHGIVLAWGKWSERMEGFPWEFFSVVSAERNEVHPSLDRVSMNHFSATDEAFHKLEQLGVKRIGLVCHDDLPLRVKKNIVGAYLLNVNQKKEWVSDIAPYFYKIGETPEAFADWFRGNQLDAVLSHRQIDLNFFKEAGIEFPRDAQYAVIEIDDEKPGIESGITMDHDLGRVLAETIAGKLHYDDRVDPQGEGNLILVDGTWRDGETTIE